MRLLRERWREGSWAETIADYSSERRNFEAEIKLHFSLAVFTRHISHVCVIREEYQFKLFRSK